MQQQHVTLSCAQYIATFLLNHMCASGVCMLQGTTLARGVTDKAVSLSGLCLLVAAAAVVCCI